MRTARLSMLTAVFGAVLAGCASTATAPTPTASTPPTQTAIISPAPTPVGLTPSGSGIGIAAFGNDQNSVVALLTERLGKPRHASQGPSCELDAGSPWAETVVFPGFWVRFEADDASRKSPRTLVSWGHQLSDALPAGVTLVTPVPAGVTFAQLKTLYPDGKLQDLGLGDGTKLFTTADGLHYTGLKKPETVGAGEFTVCE